MHKGAHVQTAVFPSCIRGYIIHYYAYFLSLGGLPECHECEEGYFSKNVNSYCDRWREYVTYVAVFDLYTVHSLIISDIQKYTIDFQGHFILLTAFYLFSFGLDAAEVVSRSMETRQPMPYVTMRVRSLHLLPPPDLSPPARPRPPVQLYLSIGALLHP